MYGLIFASVVAIVVAITTRVYRVNFLHSSHVLKGPLEHYNYRQTSQKREHKYVLLI